MKCRHCRRQKSNRPRGLCWTCYYTPEVRELFPSTSKFSRHGVLDFYGTPALAAEPTAARPGSAEKLAILEERARRGQALWHPQDATVDRRLPASAVA